jgi:pimeloyl-ACP methyl ester carboxylesterase
MMDAQDYANRLATDASGAAKLVVHLSPDVGATVIDSSSGAIVAMNLLLNRPGQVLKLVCHEPPVFGALPPPQRAEDQGMVNHIYDVYRASGPIIAMEAFTGGLAVGQESALMRSLMDLRPRDEIRANTRFWFEFEMRQYPSSEIHMKSLLALKEKFVPAAGVELGDAIGVAPITGIANAMGKKIWRLPGGHLGFVRDAKPWAKEFLDGIGNY